MLTNIISVFLNCETGQFDPQHNRKVSKHDKLCDVLCLSDFEAIKNISCNEKMNKPRLLFYLFFKVTTMAHPNLLQSPTWFSLIWWTRFCLRKSLAQKSNASAPHLSARWTVRTAPFQKKKMKRNGQRCQMAFQVCVHLRVSFVCACMCILH